MSAWHAKALACRLHSIHPVTWVVCSQVSTHPCNWPRTPLIVPLWAPRSTPWFHHPPPHGGTHWGGVQNTILGVGACIPNSSTTQRLVTGLQCSSSAAAYWAVSAATWTQHLLGARQKNVLAASDQLVLHPLVEISALCFVHAALESPEECYYRSGECCTRGGWKLC